MAHRAFFRRVCGAAAAVRPRLVPGAALGATCALATSFAVPRPDRGAIRMEMDATSLEERIRKLEAQLHLQSLNPEEVRSITILKKQAKLHGLDIEGGIVRRTSSRFCLGVEHGDYNGTQLFGVGTDRFIWLAYKPNKTGKVRIYSHNFPEAGVIEFVPGQVPKARSPELEGTWARFAYGVDDVMRKHGYSTATGYDACIVANIPGGGMSRSASLIINLLLTGLEVNGTPAKDDDFKIVDMAHQVETEYVGTPCGKLDQIMIYFAKEGMGTRYNPKSGRIHYVPLGLSAEDFRIAALDTGTVRHGLEKSTYAIRVKECQEMLALLKKNGYKVESLADIKDEATYDSVMAKFGKSHTNLCKRLTYIYHGQKNFEAMVSAWEKGDIAEVGRIFREDGIGLRDDYQISGPELETMCDLARTVPGVFGERMLGGGDKGASGAILRPEAVEQLRAVVEQGYKRSHPQYADKCAMHVVKVCQGVEVLTGLL